MRTPTGMSWRRSRAFWVHDTGTGRVLTLGLHDNYQDREIVDQVLAPLKELKLLEPTMRRTFGRTTPRLTTSVCRGSL